MRSVLPTELADRFAAAFHRVTSDEPATLEYTLNTDGETRRYEARIVRLTGDRVLSIARDITDRWRAEVALRESRQRYALATAAGRVGVWDFNVQTTEMLIEGDLAGMLGYRDAEVRPTLASWERLIHSADQAEVRARLASHISGATETFEVEFRILHKDGSVRWLSSKGAVTDRLNGAAIHVTGTYADTTERHESARALKEANDAILRMGRVAALAELSASIAHELNQPLGAIEANANACLRWLDAGTGSTPLRDALGDVLTDVRRASDIVERTHEMFTNKPPRRRAVDLPVLYATCWKSQAGGSAMPM